MFVTGKVGEGITIVPEVTFTLLLLQYNILLLCYHIQYYVKLTDFIIYNDNNT